MNPTRATAPGAEPTSELAENRVNGGGVLPVALLRKSAMASPMP